MGARDDFSRLLDAAALVDAVLREFASMPAVLTVTEWAERHRVLSAKDSAEPGPYRADRTPYAREPMDCLSQHSNVEEVVLQWGAQTSKTTIGSNWIGYLIDCNPGPAMVVQPTIDMAKRYSRQRLAPMLEESPHLKRKVRENRSRDDANTTLLKEFAGGFLALAGANSAAGLRSMPVRDLFLDEIDAYPLDADGEGDPCMLAEARQTTFSRRKRLRTSTPTTRGMSRIEAAYLAADRCRYEVPCPHCDHMQHLEWGNNTGHGIRYDKREDGTPDPDSLRYVCRACGSEIREHHKATMLPAGRWVAQRPGAADGKVRSFHLSSLYSPLGWLSWAELAQEWHTAMVAKRAGDSSLLRAFVNTRLAETYEEDGDRIAAHMLSKRAEAWPLGTVPHGALLVVQTVDVQGNRLEAASWAYGRGEESWLVDVRVFHGDPSLPEDNPDSPWHALTQWRRLPIPHASGVQLHPMACGIDSGGHHTQMVYAYVRRHAHAHVIALKGSSQSNRAILGKPTDVEVNHLGQRLKRGCKLWSVGTDTAKAVVYGRLQLDEPGPGYVHFSTGTPAEVYEQITAERLVTRLYKGRPKLEWVNPPGRRNEQLDLAVYALACIHYLGVPRYKEQDWQRLERRVAQPTLWEQRSVDTSEPKPTEPDGPDTIESTAEPAPPAMTQAHQQAAKPPLLTRPGMRPRTGGSFAKRW